MAFIRVGKSIFNLERIDAITEGDTPGTSVVWFGDGGQVLLGVEATRKLLEHVEPLVVKPRELKGTP